MKSITRIVVIMMLFVLGITLNANGRKAVIAPSKVAVISNPSESRDKRVFLFFALPKELFDSNVLVDFVLLMCKAGVSDALAGQIDIYPVTTDWKSQNEISWDNPWEKSGGDYSEEYLMNSYTLKSEWGEKEISIDVTEIMQDWHKGNLTNHGIVVKLSQDDLENKSTVFTFDEKNIRIKILYSYEYK